MMVWEQSSSSVSSSWSNFLETSRHAGIQSVASESKLDSKLHGGLVITGLISLISTFFIPSLISQNATGLLWQGEISFRFEFFLHMFRTNLLDRSILQRQTENSYHFFFKTILIDHIRSLGSLVEGSENTKMIFKIYTDWNFWLNEVLLLAMMGFLRTGPAKLSSVISSWLLIFWIVVVVILSDMLVSARR